MRRIALLVCLLVAQAAQGADPTIIGPVGPVQVKSVSWLTIEGVATDATATFFPNDQLQAGPPHIQPAHALFHPEKIGKYQVNAIVVDWAKRTLTPLTYSITVGTAPDPDPDPPDPPVPPDPPDPNKRWQIMLFHESNDLDNLPRGQVDLLSSLTLRQELVGAGHFFKGAYDRDACSSGQCPVADRPWWTAIVGDPMPRVALAPLAGGAVKDFALPADRAGLMKLLGEAK